MSGKRRYLRTSDLAQAAGVHPNTVRLYEEWGFLPPIPRAPNGYRLFTEAHRDQMRLAKTAMRCTWQGGHIRQITIGLVRQAAAGDLDGALETAYRLQTLIKAEQDQAEAAAAALEHWAQTISAEPPVKPLWIGAAARQLGVTIDMLRSWERNGLLIVPRGQEGYRAYGAAEISRLRVIRTLRRANYSTMSILRMLNMLDSGSRDNLREVLDTPSPEEDALYVT